jgi:MoaA/NifB/PqqE/SkfB family radical SAM enzyme
LDPNSFWLKPHFETLSPGFDQVEIQLTSWCNRSCSFCPSGTFPVPKQMMEWEVVDRIIGQLEPLHFSGTIGLHLMSEPLLHRKFAEIVAEFRARLPGTFIRIESNGDAIENRMEKLLEYFDAGLNEILINCYDSPEQRGRRNEALLALARENDSLWYWNDRMENPKGPRHAWRSIRLRDFYESGFSLRNWGGHVELQRPDQLSFPLPLSCDRPFQRVHVNYKGQVILCNNDWKFEVTAGDLMKEDFEDVWNSAVFTEHYRPRLLRCNRGMKLCESCDNGVPWVKTPPISPARKKTSLLERLGNRIGLPERR